MNGLRRDFVFVIERNHCIIGFSPLLGLGLAICHQVFIGLYEAERIVLYFNSPVVCGIQFCAVSLRKTNKAQQRD